MVFPSITMMMVMDSIVCGLAATYLMSTIHFIRTARGNVGAHPDDAIAQQHFTDHLNASMIGLFGGTLAFGFSILYFFAQNVFPTPPNIVDQIEIGKSLGIISVLGSGVSFMMHMMKEETPSHPYYIREYGVDTVQHRSADSTSSTQHTK